MSRPLLPTEPLRLARAFERRQARLLVLTGLIVLPGALWLMWALGSGHRGDDLFIAAVAMVLGALPLGWVYVRYRRRRLTCADPVELHAHILRRTELVTQGVPTERVSYTYRLPARPVAIKQLARKKLTAAEQRMTKNVVQISHGSGFTRYNGWYPTLFYKGRKDSGKFDALVADVHTNVPAPPLGDPGGVLHQGVGKVDLMLMAARAGKQRIAYAGPTQSHYEFILRGINRKSDSEWKKDLRKGKVPPRPVWTRKYLVP